MFLTAVAVIALAFQPPVSSLQAGRRAFEARDFKHAIEQFRAAELLNPGNAEVQIWLARALIEAGSTEEALSHLETAANDRSHPEARFQAGKIVQQLAKARYAELRRMAPDSPEVNELAGRQFELQGRLDDALKQYRAAAAKDPLRNGIHFLIGNVLWRQRETTEAEVELRLELERNADHGLANLTLGELLMSTDRASDAVPHLERAVRAIPDSPHAHRELGKAYRKLSRLDEARAEWNVAAELSPKDDQVHFLLGMLLKEIGDSDGSQRELLLHRQILTKRSSAAQRKE